ncbi:hypothetical protein F5Y12DRAFT_712371 [Xylaria sp. FL1777]|nr:hypothetical protein F5Y12DRAFT_712371 [Xylaria sp. FL1777]
MYSRRLVQILFVALSILIATRASWFHHDVNARQLSSSSADGDDSNAAATTPTDDTSVPPTTSDSPTTNASETSSSTTSSESSSTTDQSTTSDTSTPTVTPTSTPGSSSTTTSNSVPSTTPPTSQPTSSPSSTTSGDGTSKTSGDTKSTQSTTAAPVTKTSTVFYTSTDNSGQTHVGSSEAVVVSTPGFSGSDGSKDMNGGITPTQRNIIIGVTVGVGGAIILAAGGILFWRLRNKRRSQEENEELISYGAGFGGPGTAEKTEGTGPAAARSPFQSTLETYHAPTQTNAASNF